MMGMSDSQDSQSLFCKNLWATTLHFLSAGAGSLVQHCGEGLAAASTQPRERWNNMLHPLQQKVALVTGGSRGIGAAIAKRLAADGAKVAITYSKGADAAASVVGAIEQAGGKAIAIQADAAEPGAVQGAVEKTVAAFGGIDVLVNNAGTAIPKTFEETTLEEMDRVIDINVRGTLTVTHAALKHMKVVVASS
jgi:NAD(P)-dependent dehydrogenase (short-subunit alcohol dehydrogenase family)